MKHNPGWLPFPDLVAVVGSCASWPRKQPCLRASSMSVGPQWTRAGLLVGVFSDDFLWRMLSAGGGHLGEWGLGSCALGLACWLLSNSFSEHFGASSMLLTVEKHFPVLLCCSAELWVLRDMDCELGACDFLSFRCAPHFQCFGNYQGWGPIERITSSFCLWKNGMKRSISF